MFKIDGKKIAQEIIDELKTKPKPNKILAAVLVGDNPASFSFVKQKKRVADELGIEFKLYDLSSEISQGDLEEQIERLSNDERVGGIIAQLPLPKKFGRDSVLAKINPKKDVDNLTGEAGVEPPAVGVVKDILKKVGWDLDNKTVAVVGSKGFLVGQPVVRRLEHLQITGKNFNLKTSDIETKDLKGFLADADLIISGVGKKDLINPEWLRKGAGVIDFGYPPDLAGGDYKRLSFYTPTPGGTGPIIVAELFNNFYLLKPL